GGRGGADLLESRQSEDREHRTERVRRDARHGDVAVLERGLIESAARVAEARLVQRGGREGPFVLDNAARAEGDGVPDDTGGQAAAAVGERGDGRIVVP